MEKSQCPIHNPRVGNDPQFDALLGGIGIEPEQKVLVFLTVCIIVRLLLAGVVNAYHQEKYTPYIMGVVAFFALLNLGRNLDKNQWWSRKLHLVIAVLILLTSGYQILTDTRDRNIAYLLYTDVVIGLSTFGIVYLNC